MPEIAKDLITIPNAITVSRLAVAYKATKKLADNPRKYWLPVAALCFSDVLDGGAAKLGEKFPDLQQYGFRKSKFGKNIEPFTDKFLMYNVANAGRRSNSVPTMIAQMVMNQKAHASLQAIYHFARGADVQVTDYGRHRELAGNLGSGGFLAAESINNPLVKQTVRWATGAVAIFGIVGGTNAMRGYAVQAEQQLYGPTISTTDSQT